MQINDLGSAWDSMKIITCMEDCGMSNVQLTGYISDLELAQDLNKFYGIFDAHDYTAKHVEMRNSLMSASPTNPFLMRLMKPSVSRGVNPGKSWP